MASNDTATNAKATSDNDDKKPTHSILNSTFPVYLPPCEALFLPEYEFQAYVKAQLATPGVPAAPSDELPDRTRETKPTEEAPKDTPAAAIEPEPKSAFMDAVLNSSSRQYSEEELEKDNKKLTENADVAHISTKSALVDLFYELEESIRDNRLVEVLDAAWEEDPLSTVKIIFNARSIHLGKSSRLVTYRAFGWLAEKHPQTLVANLRWLTRPIIQKKVKKEEDNSAEKKALKGEDDDMVMIEAGDTQEGHDVKYGVSHGYWKDLLNLVVLAANDQLKAKSNPSSVLDTHPDQSKGAKRKRVWDPKAAKELREKAKKEQHDRILKKFEEEPFYRVLHVAVARLFATQLKEDKQYLSSDKKADLKKISLAAKWAPSFSEFHDKNTFIVSSIAEILYPDASIICPDVSKNDRELYLRHAREQYRRMTVSPLRKILEVVERDIVAEKFANIKYERVPSLAMHRYQTLFVKKDESHFMEYLDKVTTGSKQISGAILLPSTLVSSVGNGSINLGGQKGNKKNPLAAALAVAKSKVAEGQWNTLVQRIRDSGTIESSIAVCDVSGSMTYPRFKDGTTPMDSAIGLALLLAEIVEPPFGGAFITFSANPTVVKVGGKKDTRSFAEKVDAVRAAEWGMNTDFVAVFERLILPLAIEKKLKQEDMVKQVFVFSDMQFDAAETAADRWTTSFERVKGKFTEAGYEMPKLIFWNLAGAQSEYNGYESPGESDEVAPKPILAEDVGVALVSGYSQGQMKMFLENGQFEDEEVEEEVVTQDIKGEDADDVVDVKKTKKVKMDPLLIVKKAISHTAYSMLKVVD
ncbi:hypothetical protein BU16DRAFT_449862 [Lophium mytilinum]|uniref:Uncharacterized protein n=1 Tax=Lophium mytilinum TaxID=390894 RepID=A0A6A6RBD1_9PEZI|nr:hypothetical protein BU16DRAFT_449862 [Lophium mytilinum]